MFCYDTIIKNYERFESVFQNHNFMYQLASEECIDCLTSLQLEPTSILVLGHFISISKLSNLYPTASLDLRPKFNIDIQTSSTYDLIISMGQFQWINHPIEYLVRLKSLCHPGGLVYGTFLGENSFNDLHKALVDAEIQLTQGASQRVIPMISAMDTLSFLQAAEFHQPLVHKISIQWRHKTLYDLMQDIRKMGGGNSTINRSKTFAPKHLFSIAEDALKKGKPDIKSNLDLIIMMGYVS